MNPDLLAGPSREELIALIAAQAAEIAALKAHICLVAERHWDQVSWAVAENAWRFQPLLDEVR